MSRGEGSLPAGVPTPAIRREIPFLVGAAGIMLLLFGYYAYTWRSFFGFATAIDTCVGLFCDFVSFYFPMGGAIFRTALPVAGYVYSPFNAILLSVFPPLGLAASITVWGVLQALAIRRIHPPIPPTRTSRLASSVALRHPGPFLIPHPAQCSLGASRHTHNGGHPRCAQSVRAQAPCRRCCCPRLCSQLQVLPADLPRTFCRSARHALRHARRSCVRRVPSLIPGVVLGFGDTLRFYAALFDSTPANMTWVVGNYNSQHFPHVALRLARAAEHDWSPYLPLLRAISYGIVVAGQSGPRVPGSEAATAPRRSLELPRVV